MKSIIGALLCGVLMSSASVEARQGQQQDVSDVPSSGVYYWYDANGGLHVTDQIDGVPSTERADALKRVHDGDPLPSGNVSILEGQGPLIPSEPTIQQSGEVASGDNTDEDIRTKAYWQSLIADERQAKAEAEAKLESLEAEIMKVKALTPPGFHEKLVTLDQDIQAQKAIIAKADHELSSGIKERARKLDIPPGWLR